MSLNEHERLMLEQRAIDALKERIVSQSYMSVQEVARHFGVSRSLIEDLPEEVLPYTDLGRGAVRSRRRYHPADVMAADALIRRWRRAQQQGCEREFLAEMRARLEARDDAAIRLADEMAARITTDMVAA